MDTVVGLLCEIDDWLRLICNMRSFYNIIDVAILTL